MIDYLDKIYTGNKEKSILLGKLRFYSIQRLMIRVFANWIVPIYYLATRKSGNLELIRGRRDKKRYIVSLTTFPARIGRVWLVIETLLRQSRKPDMIVLWLSKDQFSSQDALPKTLLKQKERGLDIRFVNGDLRSHKKYFYALTEFADDYLILVDDDIFYPSNTIEVLIETSNQSPAAICCHRARMVGMVNGVRSPYIQWMELQNNICPNEHIFFTTGGGTILPPHSLHPEVLNDRIFEKICLYADDVWLNAMCRLNNTTVIKTDYYSLLLPVIHRNKSSLSTINLVCRQNDVQIEAVQNYIKRVVCADDEKGSRY
jgi:hypothetical protein